ncbi:Homeodomain-like protein [Xylaria palmicola]|nr:Homeodomain-like protein [Xylaria palmicola]
MSSNERRVPKRWTEEEDCILHEETQKQEAAGDTKDWHRIAAKLPGRTNKDCRKRWVNKVCGSLKKGAWNKHEDERLLDAVERHGQKWTLVANKVGFRSPDQCAKRWQSKLDPNLEHGGWTAEEDELLLRLVQENGREWKMFQEQNFSRRSTNELKNRYTGLARKAKITYHRAESVASYSGSGSSNSDHIADGDDQDRAGVDCEMDGHTGSTRKDSVIGPLIHQDLTADWVNTLDDPTLWMSQFAPRHDSIGGDIMPGVYMAESDSTMNLDKLCAQPAMLDKGTARMTSNMRPMSGSLDTTPWSDLVFNSDLATRPEDVMVVDSSYGMNGTVLGDIISDSTQGNSGSTSRTDESMSAENMQIPIESSVGRVTLVIDGCNRETLHSLLDLTKALKGKTKIEID